MEREGAMCCRWRVEKCPCSGRAWPEKHHVEVEGSAGATWALTLSETGVLRWQAITQRLGRGFQRTPVLPGPSPHTSPLTYTLEPYTTMYVSTVIRVIADYLHNCLTQLCQTSINPQLGFLPFDWSERRLFRMLTSYFSNKLCPGWFFLSTDTICFTLPSFSVIFTPSPSPFLQTEKSSEIWLARRHRHKMKTHGKCFRFEACWWISGQCVTDR